MIENLSIGNKARSIENQARAADPKISAWVTASAGSGKTTVLVNRILRLLLSGAEPGRILCLTYTTAGAVEMKNRVMKLAAELAIMQDSELRARLDKIDPGADMDAARGVFLKLVDAAVPMRIHTIHAFCQNVLRSFPIEAGVAPGFGMIDEAEAASMRIESWRDIVKMAKGKESADLGAAFYHIVGNVSEASFADLRDQLLSGHAKWRDVSEEAIRELILPMGISQGFIDYPELYARRVAAGAPCDLLREALPVLKASGANMRKMAARMSGFLQADDEDARVRKLEDYALAFLTEEGSARANHPTKDIRESWPDIAEAIAAEAARLRDAMDVLHRIEIFKMTRSIAVMARALQAVYAARKADAGVMDFDDLIVTTLRLFSQPGISEWILYKLDGGISHILVDEAQDTSGMQWRIVDALLDNFFAVGSAGGDKTLFVVGDKKQSIYGFQGADAELFSRYRNEFFERAEGAMQELPLEISFRSTRNVLAVVDAAFESVFPGGRHYAYRDDVPGYVELVPLVKPSADTESEMLRPPVEVVDARSSRYDAASILARKINKLIHDGYRPGDIMVLVRRRANARPASVALRSLGIPVAGANREILNENIAVMDMLSLARFTQYPYDDLSLAEVLKSPMFGLDDDDLFQLCHGRPGSVLDALPEDLRARLLGLVRRAGQETPHEFFSSLFVANRQAFEERLGLSGVAALEAFADLAQQYDISKIGKSMTGFADWFSSAEREAPAADNADINAVRILTAHGAKGMEARVVFLFDAAFSTPVQKDRIVWVDGVPIFKNEKFKSALSEIRDDVTARDSDELKRLMYVAMTRARDMLYIMGWEGGKQESEESWHSVIRSALERIGAARIHDEILARIGAEIVDDEVLAFGEYAPAGDAHVAAEARHFDAPEFFRRPPTAAENLKTREYFTSLAPSEAVLHGISEHKRIEKMSDIEGAKEFPEARFIFENPSRREVEIMTTDGMMRIDRLVNTTEAVWVIDYKTDQDENPDRHRDQLEKYRAAAQELFPGSTVRAAVLWTVSGRLEEIV